MTIFRAPRERGGSVGDGELRGRIRGIRVEGHALFSTDGDDIVCAAASATIYTAAGALIELCNAPESCATEREGFFELTAPEFLDTSPEFSGSSNESARRTAAVILETARIGYRQIADSYPKHLRVVETETESETKTRPMAKSSAVPKKGGKL
ncbi:MAG: ribosomal-processing cysteine protease Prp [Clostridiales bacterium]|nr:ribosomal-processing cysteine protease Prp [Clostridiales bacterium]